jgi:hypothetical protein
MLVTKYNPLKKRCVTKDIDVTDEHLQAWQNGMLIQEAMPHLSTSDREFLMTGLEDDDWDLMFVGDE